MLALATTLPYRDVLQLRSSKQDQGNLFYSKVFIYGPFSNVSSDADGRKTVVATHPARQLERRQAARQRVVNLAAHYWDGAAAVRHVVRDVSTSGAFIFADFKWPLGTIVALTLQLEGHPSSMLVRTKVVRSVPDGLGVQFLCLSKAERLSLANFLKGIA